uniref:MFS transporter n=1 Tax=Ignisphaera aggregans TaxID=334771 RepID=A0A7C5UVY3_9CREN
MKKLSRILTVFYLLGLISLFADMVYEGGRSVSGAYLKGLEAPPLGAALIGFGEFIGLVFRFFSGYLATVYQSSKTLWLFTFSGYMMTALSIPMLAFAGAWHFAVMLYIFDRIGKGLRAPTRDVILAEVSEGIGVGKGFGIHELMDQVGAFIGPLLVAVMLVYWGYRGAFLSLLIPGIISIALILTAWSMYPTLKSIGIERPRIGFKGFGKSFWIYVAASSILALGFMHWSIASYYLKTQGVLSDVEIGLMYSIAMIVDAVVAIPLGALFDRIGLRILFINPILAFLFILMLLYTPHKLLLLSAIPWGIVMCSEESIMRASIVKLVEPSKRPLAYGLFGVVFGLSWAIGGYIYSMFLTSKTHLIVYTLTTAITSLYLYHILTSHIKGSQT